MGYGLDRGSFAVVILVVATWHGAAQAQSDCAAAKIKAASRKAVCLAGLEAKEAASNQAAEPGKVQKCTDKLATAFAAAEEAGGCTTTGDAAAVSAEVDAFVGALAAALDVSSPPEPNACEAAKLRAAAKKTDCKLKLAAKRAADPRSPPNPFRLPKCHDRFIATYVKLDNGFGCNTSDDGQDIEALVDDFVDAIDDLAPLLESGCTPVAAGVLHGPPELFFGNSRLARIEDGKVPCLHTEKLTKAKCAFLGDPSGAWLESGQGDFALAGQPISRQGDPAGEYVIASQMSEDLSVPCIEPSGADMAGFSTGTELGGSCAIEVFLSERNGLGFPLRNYATRTVCMRNDPHPDAYGGSNPTRVGCFSGEDEPFHCCYTGEGAALNDPVGHERDSTGRYFTGGPRNCHVSAGTISVFAAKRPKISFIPAPAHVVKDSPLAWRPVSPTVDIAN